MKNFCLNFKLTTNCLIILSFVLKLYGSQVELLSFPTVPLSLVFYDMFVYWISVNINRVERVFIKVSNDNTHSKGLQHQAPLLFLILEPDYVKLPF